MLSLKNGKNALINLCRLLMRIAERFSSFFIFCWLHVYRDIAITEECNRLIQDMDSNWKTWSPLTHVFGFYWWSPAGCGGAAHLVPIELHRCCHKFLSHAPGNMNPILKPEVAAKSSSQPNWWSEPDLMPGINGLYLPFSFHNNATYSYGTILLFTVCWQNLKWQFWDCEEPCGKETPPVRSFQPKMRRLDLFTKCPSTWSLVLCINDHH